MVKTFFNKDSTQKNSVTPSDNEKTGKPAVKQFTNVKPTKTLLSEEEFEQEQNRKQAKNQKPEPAPKSNTKKAPSVLFSNKIKSIQSDVVSIDETFKTKVDQVCEHEFKDLELTNGDYLIIRNIFDSFRFNEPAFQIEFGNEESKKFQDVQGFLSDYAKLGKVDRILDLGQVVIELAKSINIDIFNPNKIGTKLSRLLGNRNDKVRKIKYEFDRASDRIDARINRVFDNLSEMQSTLEQFQFWSHELRNLNRNLHLKMIVLRLKLKEGGDSSETATNILPSSFQNNDESIKRWERKMQTLFALNQSIVLTFPQIDLYTSNLLGSFERLEEIKVNILQVWKQQFLTVIAVDESSDSILYYELNDIQEQLIRNIEELR